MFRIDNIINQMEAFPESGIHLYYDGNPKFFSYKNVRRDVLEKSEELRSLGVKSGMNIAVAAPNSYVWLICDLAIMSLGCCLVAIPEEVYISDEILNMCSIHLALVPWCKNEKRPENKEGFAYLNAPNENFKGLRKDVNSAESCADVYTITFSSGTSGIPKAMRISKTGTENWIRFLVTQFELTASDSILIFLPLSHLQQRMLFYVAALTGMNFILTCPERMFAAMPLLKPTMLVAPPMFYEAVENKVRGTLIDDSDSRSREKEIQRVLGGSIRWLFTGFAPIRRETLEFYDEAGMPLYEGYGVTECGQVCLGTPSAYRLGSAGKPVDDAEVMLGGEGEIMVRKKYPLSLGYVGSSVANVNQEGDYFPTGDTGRFDSDGFLYITGRTKEIIVTKGGYKVHPKIIEDQLMLCEEVEQAVVFGTDLPSLVAVISVGSDASENYKENIQAYVEKMNHAAPSPRRVGRLIFTRHAFDEKSGLLTRSLKLNRPAVYELFKAEINGSVGVCVAKESVHEQPA